MSKNFLLGIFIFLTTTTSLSQSRINVKDASFQHIYNDQLTRSYNSRGLESGALGFGWTFHVNPKLGLKIIFQANKIQKTISQKGQTFEYFYDGEDLVSVKKNGQQHFTYKYDEFHNLIEIIYPNLHKELIEYDRSDRVVMHSSNLCREEISYQGIKNTQNGYQSIFEKQCLNEKKKSKSYNFYYKVNLQSNHYLDQLSIIEKLKITKIKFHPITGKIIRISNQGGND